MALWRDVSGCSSLLSAPNEGSRSRSGTKRIISDGTVAPGMASKHKIRKMKELLFPHGLLAKKRSGIDRVRKVVGDPM
jgi:hypothetical protein